MPDSTHIDMQNEAAMYDADPKHANMPSLDASAEQTSWFEFAPAHLFYTPIALYCGWLTVRYFGLSLPTNCNPSLPYSGLVGESKFQVLNQVKGEERSYIAPYAKFRKETEGASQNSSLNSLDGTELSFPLVAKPDIGMRGTGVQLVKSQTELDDYISSFPQGAEYLLQELVDMEGEAGVFYVRYPGEEKGCITSLTLKYFPRVYGDGIKTLKELIEADPRAGKLSHLYLDRHKARLHEVIPEGEGIRLAFAGNHCRGTIFRNGNDFITDAMTDAFDKIAKAMGEFYIGRFDVRFDNFTDLQSGFGFKIIEVNGAGGEATHIWDARMTLRGAYRTLMTQFKHLYAIGAINRKRGFKPTALSKLVKAWWTEKKLTKDYPMTH